MYSVSKGVRLLEKRSTHGAFFKESDPVVPVVSQICVIRVPALAKAEIARSIVMSPFLESTLLGACPGLRESWDSHRRTFGARAEPDDGAWSGCSPRDASPSFRGSPARSSG